MGGAGWQCGGRRSVGGGRGGTADERVSLQKSRAAWNAAWLYPVFPAFRLGLGFAYGGRAGNLADCAFKCRGVFLFFVFFCRGSKKLLGLVTFSRSSAFARNSKGPWPPEEGTRVEEECGGIG